VPSRGRTLGDDDVRRLRSVAQHLDRPRHRSAAQLVRYLGGVQAQVLSAAGLALHARTDGLTSASVDRARLRDRSIVLTWTMRGTLHLIAAEDHGWLVPLTTEPRIANAHRRLRQEGVTRDQSARALRLIERMLEREGPLTRAEIAERLGRRSIPIEGQAIAHLLWLAAAEGITCHGPDSHGDRTVLLVRDWLGESEPLDRGAALKELAVRYLRSHAPAQPLDLAIWSGIRAVDAKRAWRAIEGRLVEVPATRAPMWSLKNQNEGAAKGLVRLLPSFDEYLMGWKDRSFAVDAVHAKEINRGGGWLYPVIVSDGCVVGTWKRDGTTTELHPFSRLPPAVRRDASKDASRLEEFYSR
jgi:hypothetical protein